MVIESEKARRSYPRILKNVGNKQKLPQRFKQDIEAIDNVKKISRGSTRNRMTLHERYRQDTVVIESEKVRRSSLKILMNARNKL